MSNLLLIILYEKILLLNTFIFRGDYRQLDLFKGTGSLDCINSQRIADESARTHLIHYSIELNALLEEDCNSLSCSFLSLNPMRVQSIDKAPSLPRQLVKRPEEMSMSTSWHPLTEALKRQFIAKYEHELNRDQDREDDKRFTPKLWVIYEAIVRQPANSDPVHRLPAPSVSSVKNDEHDRAQEQRASMIQSQSLRIRQNEEEIAKREAKINENLDSIKGQQKRISDNQNKQTKFSAGNIADAKEKISKLEGHIESSKQAIERSRRNIAEARKLIEDQ